MKAIVATEKNWGIGKDNDLLIHLPEDLKFFREQTLGKTIIMGRKTLESLPSGKPLPKRTTILLTGNREYKCEAEIPESARLIVVHSIDEIKEKLEEMKIAEGLSDEDIIVAGGASVYEQFLPLCDEFIVTRIHLNLDADRFFPDMDELVQEGKVEITWTSDVQQDSKTGTEYIFVKYVKVEKLREISESAGI